MAREYKSVSYTHLRAHETGRCHEGCFLSCRECRSAACSSKVYGLGLISLWLTVGKHTAYES